MYAITPTGQDAPNPHGCCFHGSDEELLSEGFAANLSTLRALQQLARLTPLQASRALCVSPRTYRRWLATGEPNPTAVRLLAILAGFVPWDGWSGWEMHRGCLFPPGYRRGGINPGEFFALVFYRQQITAQRRRIVALEAELDALKTSDSGRDSQSLQRVRCDTGSASVEPTALPCAPSSAPVSRAR